MTLQFYLVVLFLLLLSLLDILCFLFLLFLLGSGEGGGEEWRGYITGGDQAGMLGPLFWRVGGRDPSHKYNML